MHQATLTEPQAPAKAFIRDLADGQAVDAVFVVRERTRRQKRNGDAFLKLRLGDVTGTLEAVCWDGVDEAHAACADGGIVRVLGRYEVDQRYGATLVVRAIRRAEPGEYELCDLEDGPPQAYEQMVEDLAALIDTIQGAHLRELLRRFFAQDSETWRRWSQAPAAKHYHQAYRHGLLEHCLTVAQGVSAVSSTFPGIDRDVAVSGALLHDIGKIEAYAQAGAGIEMTDLGKLHGEIPLGYYMVRREIERIPGFPHDTAMGLLHIILAHHGQLEHGSPVTPCTREATLVHMIDNLGGRLGSFDRIEKSLSDGECWSTFDRGIQGSAYFARRAAEREAA